MRAYLDIETSFSGCITVIGIYIPPKGIIQWVGEDVNRTNLMNSLDRVEVIVTYNGTRFDIPVIRRELGVDLRSLFTIHDLLYECWRHGLYGGLKKVEQRLGIRRQLLGLDGRVAMRLWESYRLYGDEKALQVLLLYNREDVVNLEVLERLLNTLG